MPCSAYSYVLKEHNIKILFASNRIQKKKRNVQPKDIQDLCSFSTILAAWLHKHALFNVWGEVMPLHLKCVAFCLIINTLLTLLNVSLFLINPMLICVLVRVGNSSSRTTETRIIQITWIRQPKSVSFLLVCSFWKTSENNIFGHYLCSYCFPLLVNLVVQMSWQGFRRCIIAKAKQLF